MDLRLYARVLWRFRILVIAGLLVATGLAILATFRVSPTKSPHLTFRQSKLYISNGQLLVTQAGFPLGRSISASNDPSARFSGLATLYARLAGSDPVEKTVLPNGPTSTMYIDVRPATDPSNPGLVLPIIQFGAVAPSPQLARRLAQQTMQRLQNYLAAQQEQNAIPVKQRVLLQVLDWPGGKPQVFQGRSLSRPMIVFLATMLAVIALAFTLENLRPRLRGIRDEAREDAAADAPSRRSA
jgi:hypothetical protein